MGRMGERSHVSGPPPPQRHASASRIPDKDRLIEKLMRDNEELTSTVNELDGRLRAALRDRDELEAELAKGESERITGAVGKQLLASIQEQSALARREREEGSRSHEFLEGIFRELEKQLVAARAERDEMQKSHDRERRAARVKAKEVEERAATAEAERDAVRAECAREKETLLKQFDARIAGLRLEKEQTRHDTALFKKIERDVSEIRELTVSVLGPRAPPSGAHRRIGGPSPYASPAAYDQYDG